MRRSICATSGKASRSSVLVKTFPSPTTWTSQSAARFIVPSLLSRHEGKAVLISTSQSLSGPARLRVRTVGA